MKVNLLQHVVSGALLTLALNVTAATGGPDSFGYTYKDNNEAGGPAYQWIEIATPAGGSGTLRTAVSCDDCHEAGIPLGFDFPFYAGSFNQISISSNGTVYFENIYLGLSNTCIPGTPSYTMAQYNFIAHMWDDLAINYQGGIYTQAFPTYFVIEYYDVVPCCAAGDGDTWQVILFKNGNILMQYKELSNQGVQTDFTIGIQENPTTGLQYRCDATGNAPASGRAILFSPPSFSCSSVSQDLLGDSTVYCAGSSVTLSSGATTIAQTWSDNSTTSTINVNMAGDYFIIVLDSNGCTLRDTVTVTEKALPVVTLGSDFAACGSATLDAANAGSTYVWSEGSSTQTINVTSSGTYDVTVTDADGCENNDEIEVTINPNPVVMLGSDITACGSAILDAGNAGSTYAWSEGSNAQTINVTANGTYDVTVTDANGCVGRDTVMVAINTNPVVDLGTDITACGSTMLDAGNAGSTYNWSEGSATQTINVTSSGTYDVTVTDANGCEGMDTIEVTINTNPTVTFTLAEPTVCNDETPLMLTGGTPTGGVYSGTGVTAGSFDPATGVGTYVITYTYTDGSTGCTNSQTQSITVDDCLGVKEISAQGVNIYPNPTTGLLTIENKSAGSMSVRVTNVVGTVVVNEQVNNQTISTDLGRFNNGVYFVTVQSGKNTYTAKIILQH